MIDVDALIGEMSLEEKVAQLSCAARAYDLPEVIGAGAELDVDRFIGRFPHGVGQIGRPSVGRSAEEAAALTNSLQIVLRERTRHGFGALLNEEGVHGLMGAGATVFPAALALAATWDPDLVERVYTAVARETRSRGSNFVYAPVLDLARDPRWGRVEETFGEDPHLVSLLGVAAVRGLQGPDTDWADTGRIGADRVLACAKHFVGHGVPEAGNNGGPVHLGERELRDEHVAPFAAVIDAGVGAVMAAYHELDGVPVHAAPSVLSTLLRDELGFAGMVTSDGFGVPQLASIHGVAGDARDAARQAFSAGIDCEVPEPVGAAHLVDLVRSGELAADVVDRAARHVLRAKDRLGLLDRHVAPPERPHVDAAAHRRLALEAARRALVLLRDDSGRLPLDLAAIDSVLVTGPNAEQARLGGYTDRGAAGVGVRDGVRRRFSVDGVTVMFEEGCRITAEPAGPWSWWDDGPTPLADPADDDDLIARAVAAAHDADVVVAVVGGNEATHREGWWFDHLGDRSTLTMPGRQDELVERLAASGTPVVAVVISAGPVDLRRVVDAADAVLWTCSPGQEGGTAVAELLAGDIAPSGRLPVTFPLHAGRIPCHAGRKPSAGRGYLHEPPGPLFELGHGLTWTRFESTIVDVSPTRLDVAQLDDGAAFDLDVEIANVGERPGVELVRITVDDVVASVTRPVHRLRASRTVTLDPGEVARIRWTVGASDLALLDRTMRRAVEPGRFVLALRTSAGVTLTEVDVDP